MSANPCNRARERVFFGISLLAGLVSVASGAVTGGGSKKVTWEISNDDVMKNANGSYELGGAATADCAHGNKVETTPEPLKGKWLVLEALSQDTTDIEAKVAHAEAKARATADLPKPTWDAKKEKWIIGNGSVSATATADAKPDPQGKSYAKGEAWSKVSYKGKGKKNTVGISTVVDETNKNGKSIPGAPGRHRNGWDDPILFNVYDGVTEELLRSEVLFDLSVNADRDDGEFEWTWDESGVMLSTPRSDLGTVTGSIMINGGTTSDWITNPIGRFGASLGDGEFSATGIWASLPWELTTDGSDVVSAFLPASAFSTVMSFDIDIPLPDDDTEYVFEVSYDDVMVVEDENVPAPATLIIAGPFACLLGTRRRRG